MGVEGLQGRAGGVLGWRPQHHLDLGDGVHQTRDVCRRRLAQLGEQPDQRPDQLSVHHADAVASPMTLHKGCVEILGSRGQRKICHPLPLAMLWQCSSRIAWGDGGAGGSGAWSSPTRASSRDNVLAMRTASSAVVP